MHRPWMSTSVSMSLDVFNLFAVLKGTLLCSTVVLRNAKNGGISAFILFMSWEDVNHLPIPTALETRDGAF
jgi:cytochrome c oxidase subunit IV